MDLHLIWYLLLGVLLVGYAILDGFDLGVGIVHPLAKTDQERRLFVNAIGPLWDGNEVWLVTFGGVLFAMFPEAYATIFSGFYIAFMLLLFALIFRAVSLEFRSKMESRAWRRLWDWAFFGSSLLATLLFGVAIGNAMWGVPLDERGLFAGNFFDLVGPYQVLVGLLAVAMFAMHGTMFLFLKTEGAVQDRLGRWTWHTWGAFLVLYMLTTIYTLVRIPRATANFDRYPWGIMIVVISVLAIANIPRALFQRSYGQAFLSSSLVIASLLALLGLAIYPNIVPASNGAEMSMSVQDASSSPLTMKIGLLIVAIGFPFVLAYTSVIYWTFRGKVQLGDHSY
jgi:cytochrome d ubiquinol oxidase subunit II